MCGIVGYVGGQPALGIVIEGLRRLEYRGYDSAGIAVVDSGLLTEKRAGKLASLEQALAQRLASPDRERSEAAGAGSLATGTTGIGHTRWATHGGPTDRNAHPHRSGDGRIAVIHNGIIENFAKLRTDLEARGVAFASDTDSECVAHLLGLELAALASPRTAADLVAADADPVPLDGPGRLAWAMRQVCQQLVGAFTLLAVDRECPGVVVGARRNSPLVVGRGKGENFLASDVSAFIEYTREAIELGQDQVVTITPDGVTITDFLGREQPGRPFHVDWDATAAEKGGYDYFMLKEIAEQPRAIAETILGRLDSQGEVALTELALSDEQLREISKVFVVACGTAYHAGLVTKYAIENWTRVPCEVDLSSEFRYRDPVLDERTLVIAISQSGETMDTLMAIRHAKRQGAKVLAICNTSGSTIPRESDAVLYTRGGPEIAVASTKAFLTQLVVGYLFSLNLARVRETQPASSRRAMVTHLREMSGRVELVLARLDPFRELARQLAGEQRILFIGRHVGLPVALEAALKLKEISYMHAEGFGAGELKHGSIALIDEGTPVVCIVPSSRNSPVLHEKMISNIQEVRARGARTIVIGEDGDEGLRRYADHLLLLPEAPIMLTPLLATPPLQVLAAEVSISRGYDVDQPRNLAKSVTVE